MNTENEPINLKLNNGYEFEIGNLAKMKDYFDFESFNPNPVNTLIEAFHIIASITKCNSVYPVLFDDILALDSIDFRNLFIACNQFQMQNGVPAFINENTIKLAHGLEVDGVNFDLIEFGGIAGIYHQFEAEKQGFIGTKLNSYITGKEVIRIKQSNGDEFIEGQLTIEQIGEMTTCDGFGLVNLNRERRRLISLSRETNHTNNQIPKNSQTDCIQLTNEVIH